MKRLIIGGSGSGKSEYAESLLMGQDNLFYLATMRPYGKEGKRRIIRHKKMREGKGFTTIEQFLDIAQADIKPGSNVLLECLGNLVANEIYEGERDAKERIVQGVLELCEKCNNIVIVTNDVFCDGIFYDEETNQYLECLGYVNKKIAAKLGGVTEVVCGIGVIHAID